MGGSESKPEEDTDKSQGKEEIIEQSTGFHIIEIHMPTVNKGLGFLVFLLIAAVFLVWAGRALRKRMKARGNEARRTNNQLMLPIAYNPAEMGQHPGMFAWNRGMQTPAFFGLSPAGGGRSSTFDESRFQEVGDDDAEEENTGTWRRGNNTTSAPAATRARPMP